MKNYYFSIFGCILIIGIPFMLFFEQTALETKMEEICDNGQDDDDDGLIDLNDPECLCETIRPESLIPNPSFEDRSCCPFGATMLSCANGWIQASEATTDYVHACGYQGHFQVPLPIPDGLGCIGFRDGRPNQPWFKEYTGACLTDIMQPDVEYILNFFVGFASQSVSPATTLSLFGSSDCANLPFGIGNENFGCPANDPNWFEIGHADVSGGFGWENVEITFETDVPVAAIAIGPECELHHSTSNRYYFFDNLTLASATDFGFRIVAIEGHPCTEDLVLGVLAVDSLTYQWYKEGVAIVGATSANYAVPPGVAGEGIYQLRIEGEGQCLLTDPYEVRITSHFIELDVRICEGEPFTFDNNQLNQSGTYIANLLTAEGCDSTVTLNLEVAPVSYTEIAEIICTGSSFQLGNHTYNQSGTYMETLVSGAGCDSNVTLYLEVLPPTAFVRLPEQEVVNLGEEALLDPGVWPDEINSYTWTNQAGTDVGMGLVLTFTPLESEWFYFEAVDLNNCPLTDSVFLRVDKNYSLYIPNVFSPNGDGVNDHFTLFGGPAVESVEQLLIFDRWGSLIFEVENLPVNESDQGWDGKIKGKPGSLGVYTFQARVRFIDGFVQQLSDDLLLLR